MTPGHLVSVAENGAGLAGGLLQRTMAPAKRKLFKVPIEDRPRTMDPCRRRLIEAIHQSGGKLVLAMSGGGAGALALLLGIPGSSRTILEVLVPYHEQALVEFLGHRPRQFCSAATSRQMAVRAYERAAWLAPGENVLGVGCTASLATDRPKRGDHRFYLTCHSAARSTTYSLTLRKDLRGTAGVGQQGDKAAAGGLGRQPDPVTQRAAEEAVLDAVLLNALAEACGLAERLPVPLLAEETLQIEAWPSPDLVSALLRGELRSFYVDVDGRMSRPAGRADGQGALRARPLGLLPGAFNPVHEGHWRLAAVASRLLGIPVVFELSATNVDKPPLAAEEIRRRLQQFTWRLPVWVTHAPTFVEKASLFPGAVFVVGADTAERILALRYYGESASRRAEALEYIRRQGCRFLVAGRRTDRPSVAGADRVGRYVGLEDLGLSEAYRDLFCGIPKEEFDVAISSTAIREQADQRQHLAAPEPADS